MNILRSFFSKILIVLVVCTVGCRENQKIKTELNTYIQAYVDQDLFGGSVLVAKGGKILLSKGYLMANYEYDIPNKPQTKFRLGSLTKQFTAMVIMQLQEKGLLSVSDPISKYIPDYPNGDKITIHHLLTHTSGISNVTSFEEYKEIKLKPHTLEQVVDRFKNKPLEFVPGEKYNYSNSGYILLSYIIEKVSGKKYETILKENIFDPLNMKNTGYDNYRVVIKDRASGYAFMRGELVNATYIDMSFPVGAGGLYSTVEDLYLWDQALYTEKLVSQESLNEIFTPFKNKYGYGWVIESGKSFDHEVTSHGGGIDGFCTAIVRYPKENVCIVLLSNIEGAALRKIVVGLEAIVFGEKYELPKKRIAVSINPEIYNQYVGKYKLKDNFIITVTKENNRLFSQATEQHKLEIYPESETEFFLKTIDAQISFVKDENGKVSKLILHQDGQHLEAKKIE